MLEIRAIVYTSQTGFTARYAGMLGEATGAPVYPLKEAVKRLERGTPVFYLGWLCAGSIHGLERASRRFAVQGIGAVGISRSRRTWPIPQSSAGRTVSGRFRCFICGAAMHQGGSAGCISP